MPVLVKCDIGDPDVWFVGMKDVSARGRRRRSREAIWSENQAEAKRFGSYAHARALTAGWSISVEIVEVSE